MCWRDTAGTVWSAGVGADEAAGARPIVKHRSGTLRAERCCAVTWQVDDAPAHIIPSIQAIAHDAPVRVDIHHEGETIVCDRRDPATPGSAACDTRTEWSLAVFTSRRALGIGPNDARWQGRERAARLPDVSDIDGTTWSAMATIHQAQGLATQPPQCAMLTESPRLERLRNDAYRLALDTAARAPGRAPLPWHHHAAAKHLHIDIDAGPARLVPYGAHPASGAGPSVPIGDEAVRIECALDRAARATLARAAANATPPLVLCHADPRLEGHPWYDGLRRAMEVRIDVLESDGTRSKRAPDATPARAVTIEVKIACRRAGTQALDIALQSDVLFCPQDATTPDDARIRATAQCTLTEPALAQLWHDAMQSAWPADEAHPSLYWTRTAERSAEHALAGARARRARALERALATAAAPLLHPGEQAHARIEGAGTVHATIRGTGTGAQ